MDKVIQTASFQKAQTEFPVCFVTYFPEKGFFERLEALLKMGYQVIVYDNTEVSVAGFENYTANKGFKLFGDGRNAGLGKALKVVMQYAKENAFAYALYFDQDTLFSLQSLRYISRWMNEFYDQHQGFAAIRFCAVEYAAERYLPAVESRLLISSGSVFSLEALEQAGWHDDRFFVEGVDYKFCLDAHHAGFRLGEVRHCPDIDHESLQPLEKARVFGRELSFRRYPTQRHLRFVSALLRLSGSALMRADLRYTFIFFRNIFTHMIIQSAYYLLGLFFGMKKEDQTGNSQNAES